jgi:hypothetical protein
MRRALAIACACLLTACHCDPGIPEVFHDGFEGGCGDVPCGWTLETGTSERVSTFHSGEHGVRLSDSARITRPIEDVELSENSETEDAVQLMVWCDAGTGLLVTLEAEEAGMPVLMAATLDPDTVEPDGLMPVVTLNLAGRTHPPVATTLQQLSMELAGPGTCTIDEVRILSGHDLQCMG